MNRLSPKLIEQARMGDVPSLKLLFKSITAKNFVVSALEAALAHLEAPISTERSASPDFMDQVERVGISLDLLLACLAHGKRTKSLKQSTVTTLLPRFDALISVLSAFVECCLNLPSNIPFLFYPDAAIGRACKVLCVLMITDDALEQAAYSSPSAIRLVLRLWSARVHNGGVYVSFSDAIDPNDVLNLYLSDDHGQDVLLHYLLSSPRPVIRSFTRALVLRVKHIGEYAVETDSTEFPAPGTERPWLNFRSGAKTLMLQPAIFPYLAKEGLIQAWARSLLVSVGCSRSHLVLDHFLDLFMFATTVNRGIALREVLCTPLLHVVFESLARFRRGDNRVALFKAQFLAERLANIVFHPWLVVPFWEALNPNLPSLAPLARRSPIRENWDHLVRAVVRAADVGGCGSESHVRVCDNMLHEMTPQRDKSNPATSRGKTCSACHWVNYCSQACQRADWDRRHRTECASMRRCYIDDKLGGARYTFTMRYFQTQCIMSGPPPVIDDLDESPVLIVDNTRNDTTYRSVCLPLAHYRAYRLRTPYPAIEARVDGIVDDFIASRKPSMLIEAGFLHSSKTTIALLLRLERIGPEGVEGDRIWDMWKVCDSIPRLNRRMGRFIPCVL
ncbi:hypothetical protein CC2G_001822 [Coprinopsis cinerea AmutBmut pab1-1]|nr:hypothetical protein CC2G_001822 [Coprinopsis cinerea AmutBmut pab1-1]